MSQGSLTCRSVIYPWHCDHMGHMNVMWYVGKFDEATWHFLAAVGNLRSGRLCWGFRRGFKRATALPLFSIVLPERVHSIRLSDNSSFWDQGYPALMLTDTSFLRNPHYHMPTDTLETLDYDRMAQVALGVAGAVARIARPVTD